MEWKELWQQLAAACPFSDNDGSTMEAIEIVNNKIRVFIKSPSINQIESDSDLEALSNQFSSYLRSATKTPLYVVIEVILTTGGYKPNIVVN